MIRCLLLSAFIAVAFGAGPVVAQEVPQIDIKRIKQKDTFTPATDRAYLLVESRNRRPLIRFVKLADTNDPASATGYLEIPREKRLSSDGPVSIWLFEVPAGDYVFSSLTWQYLPNDVDCACMGTVQFPVENGQITAIRAETALLNEVGKLISIGNRKWPKGRDENDLFAMRGLLVGHPESDLSTLGIDGGFIQPARLVGVQEIPNWFGHQINRVMPIEGVLSYDRDGMIALEKAGSDVESKSSPNP